MGLEKVVIGVTVGITKSTFKFSKAIDVLMKKFDDGCPGKPELLAINADKNQIQSALLPLASSINTIDKTLTGIDKLITGLSIAVKVIKALPFPVSYPPGAGIPINVINILSDSLFLLGELLKIGKAQTEMGPVALGYCNDHLQAVLAKLGQLDGKIQKCLEELVKESLAWDSTKDYEEGDKVSQEEFFKASSTNTNTNPKTTTGKWEASDNIGNPEEWDSTKNYLSGQKVKITGYYDAQSSNLDKKPTENLTDWSPTTEAIAKEKITEEIIIELNFTLAATGDSSNAEDNISSEANLLNSLSTPPGLNYKGWMMIIENDPDNTYTFPRRRIKASKTDIKGDTSVMYNEYSYSSSTVILVNEMIFRIDTIGQNIDLSILPPLPLPPEAKELQRAANVVMIKMINYGDWEVGDMPDTWADEIYDAAWDLMERADAAGVGHWIYDNALASGSTTLSEAMKSKTWAFQRGRMNLKSFIKTTWNTSDEQAQAIFAEAEILGHKGQKNSVHYDPNNTQFLHTLKRAVESERYIHDSWSSGPNLARQAVYEIAWGMKSNGEITPSPYPGSNGFGPNFSGEDGSDISLKIGRNAQGQVFEVDGGYDESDNYNNYDHGSFSRAYGASNNGVGPGEVLPRITRHFKAYDWDANTEKWFQIPNPNAPWL